MRHYAWLLAVAITLMVGSPATAQGQSPPPDPPKGEGPAAAPPELDEHWLASDGRLPPPPVAKNKANFSLRGTYQLRFRAMTDLPLEPPVGAAPGQSATLGQNAYLLHWMRLRPLFRYGDKLEVVGEIDLPRGLVAGQTTELVTAARDSLDELRFYDVHPRQLYFQYLTPVGLVRVGQQTSHWGMGLLANDGDHPTLFGDPQRGSLVERLLFATRPGGAKHPLIVAIAADMVFEDPTADLWDKGDRAFEAVAAVRWEDRCLDAGVYGVLRHQERDVENVTGLGELTEDLDAGVVDAAGSFHVPVPGANAYAFGQLEAVVLAGSTTYVRTIDETRSGNDEALFGFGGAAKLGVAHWVGAGEDVFSDLVLSVEYGYASGDADPGDGVTRRLTFDQNHRVGLVLFDQVLRYKTARAATIAADPALAASAPPGLDLLPTEGGVAGASYLNPTVIVRPRSWLDLKGGIVIAQATADMVDPFQHGGPGNYANFDGGDERKHDLGVEIDIGTDARVPLDEAVVLNLGVEGGALFPGGAFEDAGGRGLPNQYLLNTKLGLQF